jgi:hypothetical protein
MSAECCRSTLETLSQLHGTGLAFKRSVGGHKEILKLFPELEEQIQIKVMMGLFKLKVITR